MTVEQINKQEETEIDLIEVIRKLWAKRKFILKVTVVFMALGVLIALFSPKEYTAGCTMVPQIGEKTTGGNLSGLAAMAGINLGSNSGGDVLMPNVYPKILSSVPFQKELMQTEIKFEDYEQPVRLLDYYTGEEYRKFSLLGTIKKYTIGLPGLILGALSKEEATPGLPDSASSGIQSLSKEEDDCMKILANLVTLTVNDKEGYITLSASMPEPVAAAQLAYKVQVLLQKYVTEFKIEKARANLEFIEERYADAKSEFERKQEELAEFRDANRNFASAVAKTTEERLSNEYAVVLGVYSELAKQREQANIQVKEDTPIFAVVEPVTVPTERSKPKRALICVAFTFLGGFCGVGLVLVLPFLAQVSGARRLRKWLPEATEKGIS
ncbi:MAG TPA: lipopolysaccharide biosynthesis protein [Candidatus Odoribacter faecigallinarum]|uniref:Lipopolysaccharide biosynthesis protein n=1 Tax=Candidatus Odoribacter faecigallinarum TaxID=2838706 RepID=A0A9D1UZ33_9BACT|nr:lipopolysaccharide biosynthesis protein [Candidatus Odoribacter faecigallinarum]